MTEETKNTNMETPKAPEVETAKEVKTDNSKAETKKAPRKVEVSKKEEAVARGTNLKASKKHCMYICSFIKGKSVDLAITQLQEVIGMKRAIPFKGEIPHRSQPGIMSGRYPVSASTEMIYLLKALKGNILVNGMDLEKSRITLATASWASRPSKRGGARFKRTFVLIKAKELTKNEKTKENKK